jgi:acyl-CoA thioesterase-2
MDTVARLFGVKPVGQADVFTTTIAARRGLPRLFGGQIAAQALMAACATVERERPPHSLHAYFIRMGRPDAPIEYHVDRTRDGRAFSTRHVTARQDERAIFELLASFQEPEPGHDWQRPGPTIGAVPPSPKKPHPRIAQLQNHLDVRLADPASASGWRIHPFWFRGTPPVGADPAHNAAMLTYVSDVALLANAREPGTDEPMAMAASIDHVLWFHRPPRVDEWILFSTEPIVHIGTRGLVHGAFHTLEGRLVATAAQEGLLRPAADG